MPDFFVVRIDDDPQDSYAALTFAEALGLAAPDCGNVVAVAMVQAPDAGAARLSSKPWWPTWAWKEGCSCALCSKERRAAGLDVPAGWAAAETEVPHV